MLTERAVGGLHDALAIEIDLLPRSVPIIDLGCGTGAWIERLRMMGFGDVTGVDADPPSGFIRADLDEPLRLDRKFGLVTAIEVIEHLGSPGQLLRTAAHLLDPEGVLLITTPNIHALRARTRFMLTGRLPSFDHKGDPTHVSPISIVGLERLAARHGLFMARSWTYPTRGTRIYGGMTRLIAAFAGTVAPDPLPGDNLCVMLRLSGAGTR